MNFLENFYHYLERAPSNGVITHSNNNGSFTTGYIATTKETQTGIFVDYDVKICSLACIEAYKSERERKPKLDWQFIYDRKMSKDRFAVYRGNGLTKSAVIAVRGTRDPIDFATDGLLGLSLQDFSLSIAGQLRDLHMVSDVLVRDGVEKDNIYICGHSLGSLVSMYFHYTHPESDCKVFNPGVPLSSRLPHMEGLSRKYKIHDVLKMSFITSYRIKEDPISQISSGTIPDEVVISPNPPPRTKKQAHSMEYLNSMLKLNFTLTMDNPYAGIINNFSS